MNTNSFIEEAIKKLKPVEQQILRSRFGLDNGAFHTLEETGAIFGITRERVRQIESKAFEKIKQQYDVELEKVLFMWNFNPYRCLCGKYYRKKYSGIICEKCGIRVQPSSEIILKIKMGDNAQNQIIT